jgi:CRISPR-associated protein Csd1
MDWHNACKWYQPFQKEQDGKTVTGHFTGAPSMKRIALAVLGKKRSRSDEGYEKREKELRLRLLHCIFSGEHIPQYMLNGALHHASNPIALEKKDVRTIWSRWLNWEETLSVACALYKRHYTEKKEEYALALDEKCTNRDYLYGRMLAVADKLEYYALAQKDRNRPTNALRNMQAFSQNPSKIWSGTIWKSLLPYISQLRGRAAWYQTLLDNIGDLFQGDDFTSFKPLGGAYLLGYYCQRKAIEDQIAIWAANNKKKEEDATHESEQED